MCSSKIKNIYIYNITFLFFLEIIHSQGYFIQFSGKEYEVYIIQSYIVFLLSVILLASNFKCKKKITYAGLGFLGISLISMLYQVLFPYDGYVLPKKFFGDDCNWDLYVVGKAVLYKYDFDLIENLNAYRRICMYAFVIYVMKINLTLADIYSISKKIIKGSFFVVLYGYVEMGLKNLLNMPMENYKFVEFIFGASSSTYTWEHASVMADGSYRLQGFAREPSHYVFSLLIFATLILIVVKYEKLSKIVISRWYYIELVLIVILMPMTGGMSSIWCIFSLIISYVVINTNVQLDLYKMFKCVCSLVIAIGFFSGVLGILLDSGDFLLIERFSRSLETIVFLISNPSILLLSGMDNSTLARFTSIIVCFGNWIDNPLLGLGYGVTQAHGFTATMLAATGLLGCATWYHFLTTSGNGVKKYDHLLLFILFWLEFLPENGDGGWYTYSYFLLFSEATALYCGLKNADGNWKLI